MARKLWDCLIAVSIAIVLYWQCDAAQNFENLQALDSVDDIDAKVAKRDAMIESRARVAAKQCEEVFGKGIDFNQPEMAGVLGLIAPVTESKRLSMQSRQLDPRLSKWQLTAFRGEWFAKEWCPEGDQLQPIAFHFRSNEQPLLDSALYYKWKRKDIEFSATVTSSGSLVEIRHPEFDFARGVERAKVERLLKEVFRIEDQVPVDLGTTEMMRVDLAEVLNLPETVRKGTVFGSLKDRKLLNGPFLYWFSVTKGFATENCICIALWRSNSRGHLGQKGVGMSWVGGYGHFEDPTWLDQGILESDGKTLVRPPLIKSTGGKIDEP